MNHFYFHSSEVIRSFTTPYMKILARRADWVVTTATPMADALSRIFDEGISDLLVLDEESGQVVGILGNFETTTVLSGKKKRERKAVLQLKLQQDCQAECESQCADRGGCRSSGIGDFGGKIGDLCIGECNGGSGSIGDHIPPLETLPG